MESFRVCSALSRIALAGFTFGAVEDMAQVATVVLPIDQLRYVVSQISDTKPRSRPRLSDSNTITRGGFNRWSILHTFQELIWIAEMF